LGVRRGGAGLGRARRDETRIREQGQTEKAYLTQQTRTRGSLATNGVIEEIQRLRTEPLLVAQPRFPNIPTENQQVQL